MVGSIDGNGGEGSTSHLPSKPPQSPIYPQSSSISASHDTPAVHLDTGGEGCNLHPPSEFPLLPLPPQPSSTTAAPDTPAVPFSNGGEGSTAHSPSKSLQSPLFPHTSSTTATHGTPAVNFGTGEEGSNLHPPSKLPPSPLPPQPSNDTPAAPFSNRGEGSTAHPSSKPPLSPLSSQQSSITANRDTPAVQFGQNSRRRSPRLIDGNNVGNDSSFDINPYPHKKKPRITESSSSFPNNVSFLIGDPVSDEEARRRWPWRYDCQGKNQGRFPKTNNDDGKEDKLVLNVKCHYLQAKIETHVFDLGDYACVKGEEGGHDHVGRILEFFKTNDNEDFFRIQWFFRAEDTVIGKDEAASHNKKRLFYSTLKNDNPLDCIVSKVKVVKISPGVNLKSIPACDYYYDMKYNIDYSTFSTIKDDVPSDSCCVSISPNKDEIHSNGNKTNINGTTTNLKPKKLNLSLLDMYSGCGGMSTGLSFGAKASGVNLSTKWAVDANKDACESLRLNHPETQIRNESAEDFLDLIKEWDKLCKKYPVKEEKDQDQDSLIAESADDVIIPSKPDHSIGEDEYEVEGLVDICYSDLGKNKRGLKFKVRWAGYGPSDDTWESIKELSNCQGKIHEFVQKGMRTNILPRPGDVDIICGGPPCQGISGYNRHRNFESPLEDQKNYQIVVFMEIINFLKPKYILMENVVDILRFANGCLARYAISCLVRNYFQVRLGIMVAGCYGLPQFRLRVFLWGTHADENLPPFPLPTHDSVFRYGPPCGFERNVVAYDEGQVRDLEECVLLKDAISDLPPVSNSEIRDEMAYKSDPESEFQRYIRATKSDMMGIPSGSGSSCIKKPILHDHRPFQLNEDDYLRVCRITKRKGANFKDLPGIIVDDDNTVTRIPEAELMPSGKHWVPGYAIKLLERKNSKSFARLWWDETVSTVFCVPNFRVEAVLHPEQDRVLTIRENARLQGFPDFYALCGSVNERYRQVGNAVAVPVGRALGYTLGTAFQKLTGDDEPLTTLPPKFSHSTTIDLLHPPPAATTS